MNDFFNSFQKSDIVISLKNDELEVLKDRRESDTNKIKLLVKMFSFLKFRSNNLFDVFKPNFEEEIEKEIYEICMKFKIDIREDNNYLYDSYKKKLIKYFNDGGILFK